MNSIYIKMNTDFDELLEEDIDTLQDSIPNATLTLHNDDYNSFEHVIICLIQYCDYTPIQAEQAALIVHNRGKYNIKSGEMDYIIALYKILLSEGLTVTIDVAN